tara:strand:- start:2377 stop:2805 length:429 start_codon:yes stop_codon:yes gene_type:complete
MSTTHTALRIIALSMLSFYMLGCSSSARLTQTVNVPNEKWRITSVVAFKKGDDWLVSGRLNSPNIFGLPDGHILVSIRSKDGTLLDQKIANYRRIMGNAGRHRRHQFGVALFSVNFNSIPENSEVVAELYIENIVSQKEKVV